jgi:hypothetical protein
LLVVQTVLEEERAKEGAAGCPQLERREDLKIEKAAYSALKSHNALSDKAASLSMKAICE